MSAAAVSPRTPARGFSPEVPANRLQGIIVPVDDLPKAIQPPGNAPAIGGEVGEHLLQRRQLVETDLGDDEPLQLLSDGRGVDLTGKYLSDPPHNLRAGGRPWGLGVDVHGPTLPRPGAFVNPERGLMGSPTPPGSSPGRLRRG